MSKITSSRTCSSTRMKSTPKSTGTARSKSKTPSNSSRTGPSSHSSSTRTSTTSTSASTWTKTASESNKGRVAKGGGDDSPKKTPWFRRSSLTKTTMTKNSLTTTWKSSKSHRWNKKNRKKTKRPKNSGLTQKRRMKAKITMRKTKKTTTTTKMTTKMTKNSQIKNSTKKWIWKIRIPAKTCRVDIRGIPGIRTRSRRSQSATITKWVRSTTRWKRPKSGHNRPTLGATSNKTKNRIRLISRTAPSLRTFACLNTSSTRSPSSKSWRRSVRT